VGDASLKRGASGRGRQTLKGGGREVGELDGEVLAVGADPLEYPAYVGEGVDARGRDM